MGKPPEKKKIYDDELVRAISEEFNDRIRTVPIFGDIIRAVRMSMRRKNISFDDFLNLSIDKITSQCRVTRFRYCPDSRESCHFRETICSLS